MTLHSSPSLALTCGFALLVGCWAGATSQGLPCEDNSHCGLEFECVNGFCGGEASDALCGNGYLDPQEECDEGEQNAADGVCRPDCTDEACGDGVQGPNEACDEGAQNNNTGTCKPDCTLPVCGDNHLAPGEACDDGNTDPGDGCSPTCTLEDCGNGIIEPGEDCDDGGESASCNVDCTSAVCGDQVLNMAAGEECDNDAPATDDPLCMSNCTVPVLWNDLEEPASGTGWTHDVVSGDPQLQDLWSRSQRNAGPGGTHSWDSGPPDAVAGDVRLTSPALDLTAFAGQEIELRFDHARVLADCGEPNVASDAGVVEVSVDDGPFEILTPDAGYGSVIAGCDNPLSDLEAFSLDSPYASETFDLSPYAGSSITLGFRVGWNCGNCDELDQTVRGWFIDNIVVSRQ